MAKKPKKKRVLSEEQKRKMAEGRIRAGLQRRTANVPAPVEPLPAKDIAPSDRKVVAGDEPEFEPSQVASPDGLQEPTPTEETVDVAEPVSVSAPQQAPQGLTNEQLMQMMLQMQQQIISLQQNPQIANATPVEKLEEVTRMTVGEANKARVGQNGVQGVVFRYPVESSYYPDPTNRLMEEPRLARFAMKENYIFKWTVEGEIFEKNNITFSEPRFILELYRRLWGDDGGPMRNPKTGNPVMSLVSRNIMHEDEMTTRIAAAKLGYMDRFSNNDEGFRQLMDEIRYWRIQQWLFAIFTPPKVNTFKAAPRQQVINGKNLEVFDTEELTDHDTGVSQSETLRSQTGIGSVSVPE